MRHERTLVRRFPSQWQQIVSLCEQDETFRALCVDYSEACKALIHWSKHENSVNRAREYRDIAQQLEAEILKVLGKRDAAATRQPYWEQ